MSRTYPDRPIVGVGVVVLRRDEALLVQRHNPPKAAEWSLPGGAQDVGETLRQAAQREVFEETGLRIDVRDLVDVIDFIERDSSGGIRFHYSLVDFWAEVEHAEAIAGDDAADVRWVARSEIDRLPLWEETQRVIHLAFAKRDEA